MAVYPAQLTTEEKTLKKKYARLQEKVSNCSIQLIVHTSHVEYIREHRKIYIHIYFF